MRLRFMVSILSFSVSLCGMAEASSGIQKTSRMPEAAQAKISAAVGDDLPEYYAHAAPAGFTFANSSQSLFADFDSHEVIMKNDAAHWQLSFLGYGYGDALTTSGVAVPRASANRVEYRRGILTEWYVNGPAGLEQGFTLNQRPQQIGRQPLTIALSLSGNLTAIADENGRGLSLIDSAGQAHLRYAGLTAYDSAGRELRAWLEVHGGRLLLRVDDSGARYPIVVDPTVQLAKLTASDGTTASWFGYSIAISGTTIVIGAPQATVGSNTYQGAAYVFVEPKTGWANAQQTAKLTASDGAPFNYFGGSVSIDGSTIVVGAFDAYINSVPGVGAAYVYVEPSGGWANMTETGKLTASDGVMDDFFGFSVSVSGSTVVVGEPHAAVGAAYDVGAAYVFVEPTGGWASMTQTAKLTSNGLNGDQFGQTVSINGSTIGGLTEAEASKKPHPQISNDDLVRFAFTDEQLAFRDAVRELLDRECPPSVVRQAWTSPSGRALDVWAHLTEMGVLAALAPEAAGGLGLTLVDLVLVLEETGYVALPDPIVEHAAVAVPLLASRGEPIGAGTVTAGWEPDARAVWADTPDPLALGADRRWRVVAPGDLRPEPRTSVAGARRLSVARARPAAAPAFEADPRAGIARGEDAVAEIGFRRGAQAGDGGRRAYALTDEGREYAAAHAEKLRAPWDEVTGGAGGSAAEMRRLTGQVAMAAFQVVSAGTDAQAAQARKILADARRSLYRILAAEEEDETPEASS